MAAEPNAGVSRRRFVAGLGAGLIVGAGGVAAVEQAIRVGAPPPAASPSAKPAPTTIEPNMEPPLRPGLWWAGIILRRLRGAW